MPGLWYGFSWASWLPAGLLSCFLPSQDQVWAQLTLKGAHRKGEGHHRFNIAEWTYDVKVAVQVTLLRAANEKSNGAVGFGIANT